jgi:hypothetical protein
MSRVVYQMRGQLGNQLFQYATAIGVGSRNGLSPCHYYNPALGPTSEWLASFPDHRFPRATATANFLAGGWVPAGRPGPVRRALFRLAYLPLVRRRRHRSIVDESQLSFLPDQRFFAGGFSSVEGYFQHPTYFEEGVPAVVAVCRATLEARGNSLAPVEESVAVHVRGNDYATVGWALDPRYYATAARAMPASVSGLGFTIFGDDAGRKAQTCHFLRAAGFDATVARTAPGDLDDDRSALADLGSIARHRHVVMSNSTFCWWAVALGDPVFVAAERVVVVPAPWDPGDSAAIARSAWIRAEARFEITEDAR